MGSYIVQAHLLQNVGQCKLFSNIDSNYLTQVKQARRGTGSNRDPIRAGLSVSLLRWCTCFTLRVHFATSIVSRSILLWDMVIHLWDIGPCRSRPSKTVFFVLCQQFSGGGAVAWDGVVFRQPLREIRPFQVACSSGRLPRSRGRRQHDPRLSAPGNQDSLALVSEPGILLELPHRFQSADRSHTS